MDLYSEIILDHYKNPHHKGQLAHPTATVIEYNPTCGDKITMQIEVKDGKITNLAWDGEGCAISQAAASMLAEELIGKSTKEVSTLPNEFATDLLQVPISPGRIKCALLALIAAREAAKQS